MTATATAAAQTLPVRACCATSCAEEVARTRFDEERLTSQERRLTALADPTRLRIVNLLAQHEALCVCEIEAAFDLGQPTISHHLRILRDAGLVNVDRRGTWAYYSLVRPALKEVVEDLLALV